MILLLFLAADPDLIPKPLRYSKDLVITRPWKD